MSNIKGIRAYKQMQQSRTAPKAKSEGGFGKFMKGVAAGSLTAVATVGSAAPGGGLISGVANGLSSIITGDGGNSAQQEQLDKMWAMQRESQMFNMQYLELQTEMQAENRRFSSMSNLMKVRHDTAKSAINNMQV